MTCLETRSFDKEASFVNNEPGWVKLAAEVSSSIIAFVGLSTEMDSRAFGCGAGLLTLRLAPHVRKITGVDNFREMLNFLKTKVEAMHFQNVLTRLINVEEGEFLGGRYDIIKGSMTLHHVKYIAGLFKQFNRVMVYCGTICLADFDPEEGCSTQKQLKSLTMVLKDSLSESFLRTAVSKKQLI